MERRLKARGMFKPESYNRFVLDVFRNRLRVWELLLEFKKDAEPRSYSYRYSEVMSELRPYGYCQYH